MANMANMAPGVDVQEVPSADKPIAGVGTSTAGFIGIFGDAVTAEVVGIGDGTMKDFYLKSYPVVTDAGKFTIKDSNTPVTGGKLTNDDTLKRAKATLETAPAKLDQVTVDYKVPNVLANPGDVKLCTNFTEFTNYFGGFSAVDGQSMLAHAVYGFFSNGGTRCFVVRIGDTTELDAALAKFAAIDEIAIVAVPGKTESAVRGKVTTHCESVKDRFAIFDAGKDEKLADISKDNSTMFPDNTTYAAFYYPWLMVFDPLEKAFNPTGDGSIPVPPSGHIAGIYARVDTTRGVHKAPANEVVLGAMDLADAVSKNEQAGVNDKGINCIRSLNGNITVWGARTLAGQNNPDLNYINVRRLLLFLRKSIDQGTQWVVFEPNSPALWKKIERNITAFLTNVWRDGALFGDTAQQAFYVRCNAELNPPELRDLGQVVTEIGVAIVKPAEFVMFRISQWAGPGT
jgi:phage tail sheath protein FI